MRFANGWRFVGIAYGLAITGGGALVAGYDAGGLIFILSPLVAAMIVRALGGDGLRGLGLAVRGPIGWNLLAIALFPVLMLVTIALGVTVGGIELGANGTATAIGWAALGSLVPRVLFAACEEFGWRGYLTPALAANGVPRLTNHLIVGLIWTFWHVPYILGTPGYLQVSGWLFAPLFLVGVLAMAIILGETRLRTKSVWPAVVAHGIANALAYAFLGPGVFARVDALWFAPRPDSVVMALLLVVVAVLVARVPAPDDDEAGPPGLAMPWAFYDEVEEPPPAPRSRARPR
jgi:membrane protease YdiL (CAAX protease family)